MAHKILVLINVLSLVQGVLGPWGGVWQHSLGAHVGQAHPAPSTAPVAMLVAPLSKSKTARVSPELGHSSPQLVLVAPGTSLRRCWAGSGVGGVCVPAW